MLFLALYRIAWEPVLWAFRFLAALEGIAHALTGRTLWPARWRLDERLFIPSSPEDARTNAGTIWLHAASLGEAKGLWAFAQILRRRLNEEQGEGNTGPRFLFTTNTVAGLGFLNGALEEAGDGRQAARLAPPDHPRVAKAFLRAYDVRALVFFEVELWPHWIAATRNKKGRANVPSLWISARLTERARRRYAGNPLFAGAFRRVLRDITWIQTQTEEEEHALRRLGARDVVTGGDLRGLHYLAGLHSTATERLRSPADQNPARRGIAFVSLHAHELPVLLPEIRKAATAPPENPVFVFPRRLEECSSFLRALAPLGFSLHSKNPLATRVIVDAFGRVGEALSQVRTAVIGGSFGASTRIGGHNLWEPLLAGTFIVIGPHHGSQAYLARRLETAGLLRVPRDDGTSGFLNDDFAFTDRQDARAEFIDAERARLANAADHAARILTECLQAHTK